MSDENYRSATKSHDPGWNDPPKLAFNPGAKTKQSPKINLRQRVAFPVVGTATSVDGNESPTSSGANILPQFVSRTHEVTTDMKIDAYSSPKLLAPPVPITNSSPTLPTAIEQSTETEPSAGPSNEELRSFITSTFDKFALKLNSAKMNDVNKRLEIMQKCWDENKLGDKLCKQLYLFAKALEGGDVLETNAVHRSLVVDHGSECTQWIPALRHLMLPAIRMQEIPELQCDHRSITKPI